MLKKSKVVKEIFKIQSLFIGLFLILIGNIVYFNIVKSSEVIVSPYNPRLDLLSNRVIRGKILADNGEVLAETKFENGEYERIYPYKNTFSHSVGYSIRGKSGIESVANYNLLESNADFLEKIWNEIFEKKNVGNNVVTTLNVKLQKTAYEALGNNKGAVVAIEPTTGKVLCMVSKPDYDPNQIQELWNDIQTNKTDKSFLVNRATQGLYPPASTFKILTSLGYITEHDNWESYTYNCRGVGDFYGNDIHCYQHNVHGNIGFEDALKYSCNTFFSSLGSKLDIHTFKNTCESFLFNNKIPFCLTTKKSQYVLDKDSKPQEIPETLIGQGKTTITPLHNALITSTIANGGIMMKPYLIDRVENYKGKTIEKKLPHKYKKIISSDKTTILKSLMKTVVEEGTARQLKNFSYDVAGKTGSAEHASGEKTHAWFVGFAPVDNPKIAISIIVENAGTSSKNAIPIAKKILRAYLGE